MRYVLFVCDHNDGRSQIAAALFERESPDDLRAESAGVNPTDRIQPLVVEAMAEVGIDISDRRPQRITPEQQLHADWAVTVGEGIVLPYMPRPVETWGFPRLEAATIEQVRVRRDAIAERVADLISRADDIRADSTGHQLRLQQLMQQLRTEYGGRYDDRLLRRMADEALAPLDEAPVRLHAVTLAFRAIEERLRGEPVTP